MAKSYAQEIYWQQQVDVNIDAVFHEKERSLDGNVTMLYHNSSPDTLRFIWIHLWPNAYKNDRTAFSDQQLENGSTDFYFSNEEDRGYINRLSFAVNEKTASTSDHPQHQDIVKLLLPEPLLPGSAAQIQTSFHVKLPGYYSRSGVTKNMIAFTQWYPKPAVYDRKGWHAMPYLDQGEFYSEFGNYKVRLDVPANYRIAATGVLSEETKNGERKLLTYQQDNIHDFAWFASVGFEVLHDTLQLANRVIDLYAHFQPENKSSWEPALGFMKSAIRTKSEWIGAYPYQVATVVELEDEKNIGGMEYPTITLISKTSDAALLDYLINHELGHNWFYGILASNERKHPWMDEGMNSYYDQRYFMQQYGIPSPDFFGNDSRFMNKRKPGNMTAILLQTIIKLRKDQPIETPADSFSNINNSLIAYEKTAQWMQMLESKMGRQSFDSMMQAYFEKFRFRHPYPEDFKQIAEKISQQNLDALFAKQYQKGRLDSVYRKDIRFSSFFNLKETTKHHYVSVLPAVGFNYYDKFMLGAFIHNYQLPPSNFQFFAAPLYAFGSSSFTGIARAGYTWYHGRNGAKGELFVGAAHFTADEFTDSTGKKNYQPFSKVAPGIRFTFANNNPRSLVRKYIQFKSFFITETGLLFTRDSALNTVITYPRESRSLAQLKLVFENNRVLYPYDAQLQAEAGKGFVRTTITSNYFFNYPQKGGLNLRFFAGKFFYSGQKTFLTQFETDRYHLNMTGPKGYEDYTYENYFLGRNEFEGFANQQIMIRDGAFKVRTDLLSSKIGKTDNWLAAINLTSTIPDRVNPLSVLPFRLPIKLFMDIGTYAEAWDDNAGTSRFLYDAGLQLSLLKNTVNVYVPIIYSKVYSNYFKSTIPEKRFWKTISLSIDIQNLRLSKIIPQIPL